ncbi:MAG: RNA polymerase sigma factor [Bacteroidia bacterium]
MTKILSIYSNEESLIAGLKDRNRAAYNYLYDNYNRALYGVIFRIIGNEELANDALQESFVKIWKNIEQYQESKSSIYTWMLNICRNTAIDEMRSKGFRKSLQNENIEDVVEQADEVNHLSLKTDQIGLKELVSKLKAEHQLLIDKIYFEGYTHEEVSNELQIPLGTVKTRIRAALQNLREITK